MNVALELKQRIGILKDLYPDCKFVALSRWARVLSFCIVMRLWLNNDYTYTYCEYYADLQMFQLSSTYIQLGNRYIEFVGISRVCGLYTYTYIGISIIDFQFVYYFIL